MEALRERKNIEKRSYNNINVGVRQQPPYNIISARPDCEITFLSPLVCASISQIDECMIFDWR
jgi:hypothetical protein